MSATDSLIRLARLYGDAQGIETKTVSWRLFNDSKKLAAIQAGADLSVRRLDHAMNYLSANWPATVQWPADITRPATVEASP